MHDLGRVLGKHRLSASSSIVLILLGALFAGCALFLALVVDKAAPEGRTLIVKVILGAGFVGVVLVAWGSLLRRRGSFLLCERGVRVDKPSGTRDYLFEEITETCQLFSNGAAVGIAFRAGPDAAWEAASAHLSGYAKFRTGVLDAYLAAKLPVLQRTLERGETVFFRVTNLTGRLQGAFATSIERYVNAQTERVSLNQRTLRFRGEELALAHLTKIEHNPWSGNIVFTLGDGRQPTLAFGALFEPELLLTLLDTIQAQSRAA